jgi:prepilin-type processing-associated H-X9-DG protein
MVTVPGKPAPPPPSSSGGLWVVIAVLAVGAVGLLICGGVLLALLLPAVSSSRGAARAMTCKNNLKQIAIALHNYHDTYKTFPAAYVPDENGRPMHSWRVAILPFLEQQHIFNQYDFNEPWDGPNNSQLASMYPQLEVYRCPEDTQSGFDSTSYMAVVAPDGVFEGGKWNSIADIPDGTSNTILVVEVTGAATHWMQPVDLDAEALNRMINAAHDGSGVASNHPQGVNVAMADGAVITLTDATDLETLRRLVTKSDGAPVMLP